MHELAFFGAFNPPTRAHISLARYAVEQTGAERVIFVPSRSVYIRGEQGKDFVYSDSERLNMLRAAAEKESWMEVSAWEMEQDHQPRTYETLCHFRQQGHTPALLMGSDKLKELETGWRHVVEIAREFGIVCLTRGGDNCAELIQSSDFLRLLASRIRLLETPEETRQVSSTEVRKKIAEIQKLTTEIRGMVPREILPLILPEWTGNPWCMAGAEIMQRTGSYKNIKEKRT